MQSEHVSDPAKPGLRSAERGGSTLFQKGGPNIIRQNCHAPAGGGGGKIAGSGYLAKLIRGLAAAWLVAVYFY